MTDFLDVYNGATRVIFIVGDPIAQVKSPAGVTQGFRARGIDIIVVPIHLATRDVTEFFAITRRLPNVAGIIATVPHKFDTARLCSAITERARSIGAVNVARPHADGGWYGDMCDGEGHVDGLRLAGCEPRGKRALLVGAGGAGSAIAHALVDAKVSSMCIHDTDAARRATLIAKLRDYGTIPIESGSDDPQGFDLAVNASPMGMREIDPLPLRTDRLDAKTFVSDAVTAPAVPPLIAQARARGCATMTGTQMFEAVRERVVAFYAEP
jgi:shikimate dehydrogenase